MRNIAIFAHVDAGKTTLSEQLLSHAGAIRTRGAVDHGTAHTDRLPVEKRRGISVQSSCAHFCPKKASAGIQAPALPSGGRSGPFARPNQVQTIQKVVKLFLIAKKMAPDAFLPLRFFCYSRSAHQVTASHRNRAQPGVSPS